MESAEWENGAFTEALLEGLRGQMGADSDKSGTISTDELRTHVRKRVPALTQDRQHPTVDRDNIHLRFGFPRPE